MSNRPLTYLNWTDGSADKVIQPPANFLAQGWSEGQAPPAEYFNWQAYVTDQWIQYLDSIVTTGEPDQVIRLINGGYYKFAAASGLFSWSRDANLSIAGVPDSNNVIPASSVTLLDGQVAFVTVNPPIIAQGLTLLNSETIAQMNFTGNLAVGMTVTGPGIPSGTLVTGVGSNSVQISNPATAAGTGVTLVFSNTGALTVTVMDGTAFIPTFTTIMIARRSGNKVYVGVNTGQMLLRDGEYKVLLGSGFFTVYDSIAGQALTRGQFVYIAPTGDGTRIAGQVYPLDSGAVNSKVRGTFAGMVISDTAIGAHVEILYNGFASFTNLVAGSLYYADPLNPGGIVATAPQDAGQKIVPVGVAVTTTSLLVSGSQGGLGFFSQPIIKSETLTSTDFTNFPLSTMPLGAGSTYVFVDGGISFLNADWTLNGQTIVFNSPLAPGQEVTTSYILASQSYLTGNQEIPSATSDPYTFTLAGSPQNIDAMDVFVDSLRIPKERFSLVSGPISKIILADLLSVGQTLYVKYLSSVGSQTSSSTGGAASAANASASGVGLYAGLNGNVLEFKTIVQGAGVTIVDNGDGTVSISAATIRQTKVDYLVLSDADIANGYSTLSQTPASDVVLDVIGGGAQAPNVDFTVANTKLTWSSLLASELETGDILRVQYQY